ncbi:MAG: TIGR02556 family CRISPR-associated protein [Clostridiales bacterium]
MLTAMYQLGKYVKSESGLLSIIENPNQNNNYKHVIKILFKEENNKVFFSKVDYEEFSSDRLLRYAYKSGSARGGDVTPTSKRTETSKTIAKLITSLRTILLNSKLKKDSEYTLLNDIYIEIENNTKQIIIDIDELIKSIKFGKKESAIFTICLLKNDIELYVGDFNIIKNHLFKINDEQYFIKYNKKSKGNGICYFCNDEKEVLGFVNTFNSYTVDKVGFVSGGFKQEMSWKNYPVCSECAHILDRSKKYLNENFTSRFSTFTYTIIPKVSFSDDDTEIILEIMDMFDKEKFSTKVSISDNLLGSEKDYIEIMADSKNYMNYNIFIFEEIQSAFRILLYIEDIIPSKLKNILRVKKEIDKISFFHDIKGKEGNYDMKFSFNIIRAFFPNKKIEGNFDKYFLEILNNVFTQRPISYEFLLNQVVMIIRKKFINNEYIDTTVLKAYMMIEFINKLDIFNNKRSGRTSILIEKTEQNKRYIDFLDKHKSRFDDDYKRAIFLEGVLVDKLLSIQYSKNKSKPFYGRLNGLKLDEKLIKRVFTESINKLNEYDENYYKALEELIGYYMLSSCSLSNNEISYYFVLGMTLGKSFSKNKNGKIKEDD